MEGKCKYQKCQYGVVPGLDVCFFHAPADKKGIIQELQSKAFEDRLKSADGFYEDYIITAPLVTTRKHIV